MEPLLDISAKAWGELADIAAATAIQLSPNPEVLALEMVKAGDNARNKAAIRWLFRQDSPEIKKYFRGLMGDENDTNRARGVYYLSQRLSASEMEATLVEYLTGPTYYYDVVTWIDRLLYAPSPLKEMFARELEQKARG